MGNLLVQIINIYMYIVIADFILGWVLVAGTRAGFVYDAKRFLDRLVDPVLEPIQRLVRPYMGNMPVDFISPFLLFMLLNLLQILIMRIPVFQ